MSNVMDEAVSEGRLWWQLWQWLRDERRKLLLLSLVILLNVGTSVSGPLFLKHALDLLEVSAPLRQAVMFTSMFALMLVLGFFADVMQAYLVAVINSVFIDRLRSDVFSKVLNNNITFFDNSITGRLVSRVVNDSNELMSSAETLANAFSQLFVLLGVLVTMLVFDLVFTAASVAVAPLLFIAVIMMRKFQRRVAMTWRSRIGKVNANFGEVMSSISVSKSFGREEENLRRFIEINEATYRASKIRGMAIFALGPIQDFLKHLGLILLLLVASATDDLSISLLYLFVLLQGYLYNPISQIARSYNQFQSSFAALERLIQIMADEESMELYNEGGVDAEGISGEIEFQNLSFSYVEGEPVLSDVSLHIPTGSSAALVGQTGAGKSTVVSLLMGFYTGFTGELLVDGLPLSAYSLRSLRNQIAYVAQDVFLFSGTILDNLRMGRPGATLEEVQQALDAVHATEFLATLPDGLHTRLDEEGGNLSQGQRQMVALARALITDPKILVLDEFTSSLDLYTESKIQEGIATLIQGRTSIVIAHRLTTILHSDKIIVLDSGAVMEEGTHDQLMEQGGVYSELFRKYFSFQVSDLKLRQF